MSARRLALAAALLLAACPAPGPGVDGGLDGGGDAGAPDASVGCLGGRAGPADGGVDVDAMLGAACDPTLLDTFITSCRSEPVDYFLNARCFSFGMSAADQQRLRELEQQSRGYSCAAFGAEVMACMGSRASECQVDGGSAAMSAVAQRLYEECDGGRPRFEASCADACDARHTQCFASCAPCGLESCGACSFECGRLYVACVRACPPP